MVKSVSEYLPFVTRVWLSGWAWNCTPPPPLPLPLPLLARPSCCCWGGGGALLVGWIRFGRLATLWAGGWGLECGLATGEAGFIESVGVCGGAEGAGGGGGDGDGGWCCGCCWCCWCCDCGCECCCEAAWPRALSLVRVLVRWKEPEARLLEVVGVMGAPDDVSLMGDVGESRSLEPPESFVRFFLRKPRVGMLRAAGARREECKRCPGGACEPCARERAVLLGAGGGRWVLG